MSGGEAYASAVERAKQIVDRIAEDPHPNSHQSSYLAGMKRAAPGAQEDINGLYSSSEKRPLMGDKNQAQAAAEAAARISQKLGGPGAPAYQQQPFPSPGMPPNNGQAGPLTVHMTIPDRFVGLVIGKRGEQITSLQAETQCKVQISQESGVAERPVTLIGNQQQIEAAKRMIQEIINRADRGSNGMGGGAHPTGDVVNIEMRIPGNKAGLIIGKGGETIRSLQEEHGVKMVLIQQSNVASMEDKPLRITGEVSRVNRVKGIIMELINSRQGMGGGAGAGMGMGMQRYGQEGQEFAQFAVPAEKAGLVIGKGGESIKEICRTTNCHVEISKEPAPNPAIKLFNIRGSGPDIEQAKRMISDRAGIPMAKPSDAMAAQGYGSYPYMQDPSQQMNAAAYRGASNMPAPTLNPYTGQPDYSQAWIEYYRQMGMHEHADAIQRQAQQQAAAAAAAAAGGGQAGAGAAAGAPNSGYGAATPGGGAAAAAAAAAAVAGQTGAGAGGQDYQQQWQQWQQWQWQQQQQQQSQQPQWQGATGNGQPAQPGAPMPTASQSN